MKLLLFIGVGSFIGGILRYLLSLSVQNKSLSAFPFGTLSVNILGCFMIGVVYGLTERVNISSELRLFLATGLCGGFTTFSAFGQETLGMLRDGQVWYAVVYIVGSVILGIAATFVGYLICKLY